MSTTPTITLSVRAVGEGMAASLLFHVRLNGQILSANRVPTSAQFRALHESARSYLSLFESQDVPRVDPGQLQSFGTQLFEAWFGQCG